ncbi:MAG: Bifunctional ligase/repressor BirA [Turneriella sp.]|nr:Bifunctional ligase/repressor BirA [Turneriella sp.]
MPKGRYLLTIDEVASTNSYLKEQSKYQYPFFSVRARRQTLGRGRFEKSWFSGGVDENLAFSIVLPVDGKYISAVPLALAQVLHLYLSKYLEVTIKWPNDILCNGKKLVGILCESLPNHKNLIVAGIGVNVQTRQFAEGFAQPVTSLALEGVDKRVETLWLGIYRKIVIFFRKKNFPLNASFIRRYNSVAYAFVERVHVSQAPLEFQTLLPDGRAIFRTAENGDVILDA